MNRGFQGLGEPHGFGVRRAGKALCNKHVPLVQSLCPLNGELEVLPVAPDYREAFLVSERGVNLVFLP